MLRMCVRVCEGVEDVRVVGYVKVYTGQSDMERTLTPSTE